ncbi:putative ABC transport system ATP-binding protein [Kibdelosporangium banguiense]|uniref:ABC transport system ATP-binding protein n=1 Tax=Kibdelosporangium banguiense TaxID=1365924 RepID=A0ABS4TJU2_9PSEU|nr:ATP-binding cassette domain-containing protein [Kibdelosporangium banguiense]MBP2324131.1 putative ABC transport system ATP-binding protein [Kibdelosporangium banguiense]
MSVVAGAAASARGLVWGRVLRGVDLEVPAGQLTVVVGVAGAGKTTLLDCVGGLRRPDRGNVHIGADRITGFGDAALTRVRRDRIGFVFATCSLLPSLSVGQNIRIAQDLGGSQPDQCWFDTVVDLLGLAALLKEKPDRLTAGQRQRVACARAFLNKPDVVLADEPAAELDRRESAALLGFLRMWVRKIGQAVLLATSDPFVAAHADRVLVLADGRITGEITRPTADSVRAVLERR